MININHTYKDCLFSFIRSALWGETHSGGLSAEGFKEIMTLAEQQTVTGLVFDALQEIQIEGARIEVLTYVAIMEQVKQYNRELNNELKDFALQCKKNNIDYFVVKGQTVAALYRNPLLRSSGDIDFLVKDEYDAVKSRVEMALGVMLPRKMLEKEVAFDRHGAHYELHTSLRTYIGKSHQKYWDALIEKEWAKKYYVEIDGQQICTLSPTINVAYIFIHLFFHFIREGIALRQLCDWTMALHHYKDEIDCNNLKGILKGVGMLKAFKAFGVIIIDELGLPVEEFPFKVDENDRKWKGKILRDIFAGGNFGKLNHNASSPWRYKLETMTVAARNSIKYFPLAPIEAGLVIPRLIWGNCKVIYKILMKH